MQNEAGENRIVFPLTVVDMDSRLRGNDSGEFGHLILCPTPD